MKKNDHKYLVRYDQKVDIVNHTTTESTPQSTYRKKLKYKTLEGMKRRVSKLLTEEHRNPIENIKVYKLVQEVEDKFDLVTLLSKEDERAKNYRRDEKLIRYAISQGAIEAKKAVKLLNILKYGKCTCEICHKEILVGKALKRRYRDAKIRQLYRASVDHIYPKSKGGTDKLDNLQMAHVQCNVLKGNKVVCPK